MIDDGSAATFFSFFPFLISLNSFLSHREKASFYENKKHINQYAPYQTVNNHRYKDKVSRKKAPRVPCHGHDGKV